MTPSRVLTHLLLAALLSALVPPSSDAQDSGIDPVRVEAALTQLDEAFARGEKAAQLDAIRTAGSVPHVEVLQALEKRALKSRDAEVRRAVIEAFRYSPNPAALEALHRQCKTLRRELAEDPETATALLRAIGQHANPESIDVLTKDAFRDKDRRVLQARILSLGRIRSEESVDALIGLMKKAGPQHVSAHMRDFRAGLMILTGVDQGDSADLWNTWYQNNKKKLAVSPEPSPLPQALQRAWDRHWNEYGNGKRRERREDRG